MEGFNLGNGASRDSHRTNMIHIFFSKNKHLGIQSSIKHSYIHYIHHYCILELVKVTITSMGVVWFRIFGPV